MLNVGDIIRQVKVMGSFNFVDSEFEISDIQQSNNMLEFQSDFGVGYMSMEEFEQYFIKVETKHKWTDWIETKDGFSYRTDNEKYTEVKKDGICAKSSCHPCDKFSLAKGIAVCLDRIKDKKKEEIQDEVILTYGSPYLYNIVSNSLKNRSKDENEVKEELSYKDALIDILKNLNGKIVNLETSVEEKVYNGFNPEFTGIKYYTIKFTEIL